MNSHLLLSHRIHLLNHAMHQQADLCAWPLEQLSLTLQEDHLLVSDSCAERYSDWPLASVLLTVWVVRRAAAAYDSRMEHPGSG